MMTVILNVLCEGQTEDRFVHRVLKPYLQQFNIVCKTQLLTTSRKKNAKGGVISYDQVRKDLERWMKHVANRSSEKHYFTTMLDLYRLPVDFPEYQRAMSVFNIRSRIGMLEDAFAADIDRKDCFIPYIQLHEFEALVFCGLDFLCEEYPNCAQAFNQLKLELERNYGNDPEAINHGVAPSTKLEDAVKGYYHYNKPKSGVNVVEQLGIDVLKQKCEHFCEWLNKLEQLL